MGDPMRIATVSSPSAASGWAVGMIRVIRIERRKMCGIHRWWLRIMRGKSVELWTSKG